MDISKLLKNVSHLNQYVSITQDATEKCKNSKIQFNMSTVLSLKKIRSLEIEYFSKCEENGIACVIFDRMLSLPPSKTWSVLGKELVILLQYWLDALRKHLVKHSLHWWNFMKLLLKFLREIRNKDASLPNILVEQTTECLLDLATSEQPDAIQRHNILHCLNMFCSESSREIRFALRNKFGNYFLKLSVYMSSCGHLPCQYSILETLLRWLLPRQDRTLRVTAATKWFPPSRYSRIIADMFLERTWMNFFQDARDLLNTHNEASDLITSVVCKRLTVGNVFIISGTEKLETWLDINTPTRCMSVLLDPRVLEGFDSTVYKTFETLVISEDNTQNAKLYREEQELMISVSTLRSPQLMTSSIPDDSRDVIIAVTTRDLEKLDKALRSVFGDKYQVLIDLENDLTLLQAKEDVVANTSYNSQDIRFSHPAEVRRQRRSGHMTWKCQPSSWKSPSTASTTSLAHLHEKLEALPRYCYDKVPVGVCASPELSVVAELNETDDRHSVLHKPIPYGVLNRKFVASSKSPVRKSQSDTECRKVKVKKTRELSPVIKEDSTVSCLLVATIGSTDDSIINDTVERLSKQKDFAHDNLVDMLVKEAIEASNNKSDEVLDSGINTGDKKTQYLVENIEAIENTAADNSITHSGKGKAKSKVVETTSTDESNTDFVNETPIDYVNVRRNRKKGKDNVELVAKPSLDAQIIEEFFTQHFAENKASEIVTSPTLARKINETSSETSNDVGENYILMNEVIKENLDITNFNDIDVIECLNNMVDKVCDELHKFYNTGEMTVLEICTEASLPDNMPLQDIINIKQNTESAMEITKHKQKSKKIKLTYKITPKKNVERMKTRAKHRQIALGLEGKKVSTIIEDKEEEGSVNNINEVKDIVNLPDATKEITEVLDVEKSPTGPTNKARDSNTPLLRRKRKLYSPKDDQIEKSNNIPETDDDDVALSEFKIKKTPKSKATCYKEIEKDRQKHIRMPRKRRSNAYIESLSPRTKKYNDMFDKLKDVTEGEKVTLADKNFEIDVYNFTSDSEDEDFKKKKDLRKKNSATTIGSVESALSRHGRQVNRVNYKENKSSDESKGKRKVTRRKTTKTKNIMEPVRNLQDERMREAKDVFNTSIVVDKASNVGKDPELILQEHPVMEIIVEVTNELPKSAPQRKKTKKIKAETAEYKKQNKKQLNTLPKIQDDRTESPLPGLLVETVPDYIQNVDLSANMIDKLKKIYQEGPENYVNETNTTQSLLLDMEKINNSDNNDVSEEIGQNNKLVNIEIDPKHKKVTRSVSKSKKLKIDVTDTNVKSKKITRPRSSIEVINVAETVEVNSERSIDTQGITAHGDFNEKPPKFLEEKISPRNLDIEDLNQSVKDYFDKLTKEIDRIDSNRISSKVSSGNNSKSANKSISNLSPDISKWLSKRNISENVSSEISSKSIKIAVNRLSPVDISRWLPSRRNSDTDSSVKDILNERKISDNEAENQSCKRKSLRLLFKKINPSHISKENSFESLKRTDDNNSSSRNISPKPVKKGAQSKKPKSKAASQKAKHTSMISPIKLFDDLISNSAKTETSLSDDEDYMREIKDILARKKSNIESQVTKYIDSSPDSKVSTSTKLIERMEGSRKSSKRVSPLERVNVKKIKIDVADEVRTSGVTASSIDGWFKRNDPSCSRAEIVSSSLRDSVHNILERIDTTLVEIHQNTSRKFVRLFVDAQRHLSELKQVRRDVYKQMASDILSQVVQMLDQKFADLDKKSQEMDDDFMKQLKEQASELIREDCKQKRVMVRILKEDVQAVMDHLDKQGESG